MLAESQNVLSISPIPEDHRSLDAIIGKFDWNLFTVDFLPAALAILPTLDIAVIVCECDLLPGVWTDLLEHLKHLPYAPALIVTSTHADEQLWAEALNLGAWDVLAKPFDRSEVLRTVGLAWHHWQNQRHSASPPPHHRFQMI
jgi:DNA-binding NtrC family response regulator